MSCFCPAMEVDAGIFWILYAGNLLESFDSEIGNGLEWGKQVDIHFISDNIQDLYIIRYKNVLVKPKFIPQFTALIESYLYKASCFMPPAGFVAQRPMLCVRSG